MHITYPISLIRSCYQKSLCNASPLLTAALTRPSFVSADWPITTSLTYPSGGCTKTNCPITTPVLSASLTPFQLRDVVDNYALAIAVECHESRHREPNHFIRDVNKCTCTIIYLCPCVFFSRLEKI